MMEEMEASVYLMGAEVKRPFGFANLLMARLTLLKTGRLECCHLDTLHSSVPQKPTGRKHPPVFAQ